KAICDSSSGVIRWTPAGRFFECARNSRHTIGSLGRLPMLTAQVDEFRSVPYRRLPVASGAADMGRRGGTTGNRSRIRLDEAGVVVRWRLQRVRALVAPPQGTGEEPR